MKMNEVAAFGDVLIDCKLAIHGLCSRAGMKVFFRKTTCNSVIPDRRSSVECFLTEEVKENFEIFAAFVAKRI
jgi:hypothetical protein